MDNELYPELNEQGKLEAQKVIDQLRVEMAKVCEKVISQFYIDISCYIESDHWTNYRNSIMNGLKNYGGDNRYDYKKVREEILKEHREEIIKDLNADLLDTIEDLKAQLKFEQERKEYY
jgi:hypothetical protein